MEPGGSIEVIDVHAIEEQHVKVDVEVQRRAKSLDEGDCTRPGRVVCIACFLDQMRGNHAVDDAQRTPHDLGLASGAIRR